MRRSLFLLAVTLLAACTTTSSTPTESAKPVVRSTAGDPSAQALGDVRVIMYQTKQDLMMVLVNESNADRKTERGRLNLALGDSDRAYKVLTDQQMSTLIASLENRGFSNVADAFLAEDSVYLTRASGDIPRFQGVVVVERDGIRRKVLGMRALNESDTGGHQRYKQFVDFKTLVTLKFQATSNAEAPIGGVIMPASPAR